MPYVHLTSIQGQIDIQNSGKVGGKWGIYVLGAARLPKSTWIRVAVTLVRPEKAAAIIPIPQAADVVFKGGFRFGPFGFAQWFFQVARSPLGSIDLATGALIADEILVNGVFRQATRAEKVRKRQHDFLVDYVFDGGFWLIVFAFCCFR